MIQENSGVTVRSFRERADGFGRIATTHNSEREFNENQADIFPYSRIKGMLRKFHEVLGFVKYNHAEKIFSSRAILASMTILRLHIFEKLLKLTKANALASVFFYKTSGQKPLLIMELI